MSAPLSLVAPTVIDAMLCEATVTPPGCFVEVGVYKGGTAWHLSRLAELQKRPLFLFDTFEGIPICQPEMGDQHVVGDFADTSVEAVQLEIPYATCIKGVFPWVSWEPQKVAFAHLDVDQYDSYRNAMDYLHPWMAAGGIMWFDDVGLRGAERAIKERYGDTVQQHACGKWLRRF